MTENELQVKVADPDKESKWGLAGTGHALVSS